MASRFSVRLKQSILFAHRWMGVCFCVLFLLWFCSGMVLMYWDYPMVSARERLERQPALDASQIHVPPEQAYSRLQLDGPPQKAVLAMFNGRPAYRFGEGSDETIVYADTGEQQVEFSPELALAIASAWTKLPPREVQMEVNTAEDQWTVSGEFRDLRPMLKCSWADGEQVYVSLVTGAVVQYTTRASRLGAYFGAIPHWLYFTPLRKHGPQWSKTVIWASGLATCAAILGIAVGVWTFSPRKSYRYAGAASSIPYSGQKRWHMILGLVFGVLACTWAFSGMLSMDPFAWQQDRDELGGRIAAALQGAPLQMDAFVLMTPREALAAAGADFPVRELDLTMFAGEPAYLALGAPGQMRVIPVGGPLRGFARIEPAAQFDPTRIVDVVKKAVAPVAVTEFRLLTQYDAYYLDRHHELPLPVLFIRLADAGTSTYYIDPQTAQLVEGYNTRSRWNRWLYHGLHSMNLPWLYEHRPAWDMVVLALMLGGAALSVTSLILAWRVLRRKLGILLATTKGSEGDDTTHGL
jgi:hypothetical protein